MKDIIEEQKKFYADLFKDKTDYEAAAVDNASNYFFDGDVEITRLTDENRDIFDQEVTQKRFRKPSKN